MSLVFGGLPQLGPLYLGKRKLLPFEPTLGGIQGDGLGELVDGLLYPALIV